MNLAKERGPCFRISARRVSGRGLELGLKAGRFVSRGDFWKAVLRVGRAENARGWNVSLPEGRLNGKEESLFSLHVDL